MNKCNITIKGKEDVTLAGNTGGSLMNIVNNSKEINYTFPCGGNGRCGKCTVRILKGDFDITSDDRKFFSEEQLKLGYRLACKAIVTQDCVIEYKGIIENSYDVQSDFVDVRDKSEKISGKSSGIISDTISGVESDIISDKISGAVNDKINEKSGTGLGIAIDIGTTTIALSLVDLDSRNIINTYTSLNHQRKFGADVIARIKASNDGNGEALRSVIQKDLLNGINYLIKTNNIEVSEIKEIAIAGNTTMGHLLLGYSCETLGVFPFTPVDISAKTLKFNEVFGNDISETGLEKLSNTDVYFLPGISTYVGADITSGILHCCMNQSQEVSLLIDLGTNGEMAIGNSDKILVTSTAAGPAFEGGNISCGTGSIDGAICDVKICDDVQIKTINNKPPVGICGTGVIAVTAELLENEIVDETGRLDDEYFEEGFKLDGDIVFTQKDIREIQLAKSAIRAGAKTLILRYGIDISDISKVYLAGGFGYHIDLDKAIKTGLLDEALRDRIIAVGNSSLAGAVLALSDENEKKQLEKICDISQEISLSDDRNFQEFYMDYMMFEDE